MNVLTLLSSRDLSLVQTENLYEGENKIISFEIRLPDTIGDYDRTECDIEMRCYIDEGYLSYTIDSSKAVSTLKITTDITEKPGIVKIMFVITHEGNVIGKTNKESAKVTPAPPKDDEPLTPREEFDRVIAEQRQTILNQAETITEQSQQIEQDSKTITDLNTQVDELTADNTRLETQYDTDQETIRELNRRVPAMYTPPQAITPSGTVQTITPPANYAGLASVTVDRVTAEVDSDIQTENIKEGVEILGVEGTYNPFPYNSAGGIYITEVDDEGYPVEFLVKNLTKTVITFPIVYQNVSIAKTRIKQFIFENCTDINYLAIANAVSGYFEGMTNISKIELPENLLRIDSYMFFNCLSLKQINIPATLSTISGTAFMECTSLQNVTIENGFNCNNLKLSASTLYSHDTILSWFNALADRTGLTAYTLTIGATNLAKLSAEEIAIATNKNWNLA